jgi:transposase-like protein
MSEEVKRWTSKRKSGLVIELLKVQTTISEASRQYDLTPSDIKSWVDTEVTGHSETIVVA